MSARTPPHSLASERRMLGTVLLWPDRLGDLEELAVDDLWLPAHRHVLTAMRALAARGVRTDPIVVSDFMRTKKTLPQVEGGEAYLLELAGESGAGEAIAHDLKLVRGKATLRRMITLCSEMALRCYAEPDVDKLMAEFREEASKLELSGTSDDEMVRVEDAITGVFERLEDRAQNPDRYVVRTGIREFDKRMGGGLFPEKLVVVAAPPGMGKSAYLGTVTTNAALTYGVPCVIFSMEMNRDELIGRFVMGQIRRNTLDFTTGAIAQSKEGVNDFYRGAQRFNGKPLFVNDRPDMTLRNLMARMRRWYAKVLGAKPGRSERPKPALIGIDYLQLLNSNDDDNSDTLAEEIGVMTRAFKIFAGEYKVTVILVSQLNRQWSKRGSKPALQDLHGASAIEKDADMVIFPWVDPSKDNEGKDVIESGPAELIVAKNRGGPKGTVPTFWKREYTRFEDIEEYRSEA